MTKYIVTAYTWSELEAMRLMAQARGEMTTDYYGKDDIEYILDLAAGIPPPDRDAALPPV